MLRKWLVESVVEVVFDGISPMLRERLTHKMVEKVHAFFDGRSRTDPLGGKGQPQWLGR